jgi:hypothetical protein
MSDSNTLFSRTGQDDRNEPCYIGQERRRK